MPSNKTRFEVFKRDLFRCQYCGRTPPDVVLEVDHIIARANGGADEIDNYITSCFDCNRGKGSSDLTVAPESIIVKIDKTKEKQKQLLEYTNLIKKQDKYYLKQVDIVDCVFQQHFLGKALADKFCAVSLKRFVKSLPTVYLKDAMNKSCSLFPNDPEQAIKYFCGICWKWIKQPETRDW